MCHRTPVQHILENLLQVITEYRVHIINSDEEITYLRVFFLSSSKRGEEGLEDFNLQSIAIQILAFEDVATRR